jgi:hypothetical protein
MATLRERPFVSKPSDALKARMEQARQGGFFVVQTPGPTSFVLKSDQESKKLKVNIGSVHSCSCGAREQPCVHVAFVLLRVFRLEPTDQRCWQASLTDSELEALVDSRARAAAMRRREARQWAAAERQQWRQQQRQQRAALRAGTLAPPTATRPLQLRQRWRWGQQPPQR